MKHKIFTILFLSLIVFYAQAQTGGVFGKISDMKNQKPVEYATVTLLASKDSSMIKASFADSSGNFEFKDLDIGKYLLAISSVEYQKYISPVFEVNNTNVALGNILLSSISKELAEVVVTAEKPAIERQADKIILNVASNSIYKTSTNALDVLKKAPGLQVKPDGTLLMRNSISPKIFIDGKDIPMSATEVANYLKSLTPDMIESIEIMNNPSSKYDSQYKGIINIVLKRDKNLGFNGSFNSGFRQNSYGSWNNNLNLNYKTKKFAYTARIGFDDYKSPYHIISNQILANANHLIIDSKVLFSGKGLNYQFGVDFNPTKNQTIGILFKAYENKGNMNNSGSSLTKQNETLLEQINTVILSYPKNINNSINISYSNNFKNKSTLSALSTYGQFQNTDHQDLQNMNVTADSLEHLKTILQNIIKLSSSQIDYSVPIAKGKLELGSKLAITDTYNNLRYDKLVNKDFILDLSRTNIFNYNEKIVGGYVNFSKEIKKLSYQLGLRLENTKTKGYSETSNTTITRNYYRWLPSATFNYNIDASNSLNLSMSRRLTRPNFGNLNPFKFYISPYAYAVGNPYLMPQITNLASLTYNYKSLSMSVNGGFDQQMMTQLPYYDKVTSITAFVAQNISKNNFAYSEISHSYSPKKWWQMQHNLGLYYNKNFLTYNDVTISQGIVSYSFSGSQVFTTHKAYVLDFSYNYYSGGEVLYTIKPMYGFNFGVQKKYLKDKLNVKLNLNDVTYTNYSRITGRRPEILNTQITQKGGSRSIGLQLTYNFGKSTFRANQKAKTEEERRASK